MVNSIHPTAIVSPKAQLGENVSIGPFSIIHDDVRIGHNSSVAAYCELGYPHEDLDDEPMMIGSHANIRSHTVIYQDTQIGDHFHTGHRVTVREGTRAGDYLALGTLCDIQGTCVFGDHVRLHSNVHIGQHSHIEDFVWIFPYTVLTNDPHPPSHTRMGVHIERYAILATMVTVMPGVRIHSEALIGAMSLVTKDVSAEQVAFGVPARERGSIYAIKDKQGNAIYPWFKTIQDRYPEAAAETWKAFEAAKQKR